MLDGEQAIIKQAVGGKSSAFGTLFEHYQPMIYRFVLVKVARREDAEDITHQVFLAAWQNIKGYKYQGHPFSSWLYQIARNQVVDHYRAKKNETSLEKMDPEYFVLPASATFDLSLKLDVEKVRKAIGELKSDYQDIIVFRFIEELSLKEIAQMLHKSEGAVKLMQHRAIKELQRIMGESEE
ncbi:MAG TPA: sigma-70 family RNA polymerase sigma factor [Candidatus Paceibacterota bacterium]|jgi:RNA polymerase sigma-70 factor (ECF subfamily)|nr:sigma-70 family RNA polymerase sigma factor [Candidatus Paceibacterota bacterium]